MGAPDPAGFAAYVGAVVVVDTGTPLLYIGTLAEVTPAYLTLTDVDVQDATQLASTKEVYILDARKYGIKMNRKQVRVRADAAVSVSKLEDVIEY